jgi:hypothetical protein
LASVTVQLPLPPAAKLAGGVLLIDRRGTVAVVTVQLEQVPLLVVTLLTMLATLSVSVLTVTVNVFVTVVLALTVTDCV